MSFGILAAHAAFLRYKERHDSRYTLSAMLQEARVAWIERMMGQKEGVLAVQTMRNQIMAATFFASTAILLIIGTLTLTAQGERLVANWSLLSPFGAINERVWLGKVMFLLVDLLFAFGLFAQTIRLLSHVSMLVSVPSTAIRPRQVAALMLQAGRYNIWGIRCYYYAVPLLFWLFGPIFFVGGSIALVLLMLRLHRAPAPEAGPIDEL